MTARLLLASALLLSLVGAAARADEIGPPLRARPTPEERAEYYRSRAEAGDPRAQSRLALLYRNGLGVAQSDHEAYRWILKAAKSGETAAQHYLGLFYLSGVGTPIDLGRAAHWLRRWADRQEPGSLLDLARFELDENGIPRFAQQATAVVRNGAERGLDEARRALALLQSERVPPEVEESGVDWLRQSAEGGHPEAQYQLALALYTGRSMPADPPQATTWFERSAAQGDPRAMRSLGICHLSGRGATRDDARAYQWFWLAQRHGDSLSDQDLAQLDALLPSRLREHARTEAREWEAANELGPRRGGTDQ